MGKQDAKGSTAGGLNEAVKPGEEVYRVWGGNGAEMTNVIGRVKDLKNLEAGEKSLLDRLPDLGNPKANWRQNAGVLREEMRRGLVEAKRPWRAAVSV